jgi:hypothetical protein
VVERFYSGTTDGDVTAREGGTSYRLPARLDLRKHSPAAFAWGCGSAPAQQLALALLADALGDDRRAIALYQDFKFRCIAQLPSCWIMSRSRIMAYVDELEAAALARPLLAQR